MKKRLVTLLLMVIVLPVACQSAPAVPAPTPAGPLETQTALAIHADQTSTVAANYANLTSTAEGKKTLFEAILTADALTAVARPPTSSVVTFDTSVRASACWVNSDVRVTTGQKVSITASGTVNTYGGRAGSSNDPDGQEAICGAIECPVQGVGYGALVGRVHDGQPFFIGTNLVFVSTRDGQLYFTVNDWECDDNSGTFDLTVNVE
jgi:hypothetical protein